MVAVSEANSKAAPNLALPPSNFVSVTIKRVPEADMAPPDIEAVFPAKWHCSNCSKPQSSACIAPPFWLAVLLMKLVFLALTNRSVESAAAQNVHRVDESGVL